MSSQGINPALNAHISSNGLRLPPNRTTLGGRTFMKTTIASRNYIHRLPGRSALILVLLLIVCFGFSPMAGGSWNVVPSPNTGFPNNYLFGVAAIASNDVWAVGAYGDLGISSHQVIEHWDGTNWRRVANPAITTPNDLLAVSAVTGSDVWAVGGYNSGGQGLIQHWNGTSWQVIPSPNIPNQHNQLNAVTAVPGSPNELWAVGEAGPSALILHWNGTQWSIVPSPNAGIVPRLMNVVAISANDIWAVGWTGGRSGPVTLTEHWNGSTWSRIPSPNPSSTFNYLHGVTAVAANNVWAVGEFNATGGNQQTLFLQWNGSAWVQVPGDNTGPSGVQFFVSAVSAISGSDIWSVGNNSHTLAQHWNGTSWSIVSTPNAGIGDNMLNGVSGTASTDVWEVGYYEFGTWKR